MRYALLVALIVTLAFTVTCDSDGDKAPTPTQATGPTITPTVELTVEPSSFREFAADIQAAILREDSAWFQQRLLTTHVICDQSNTPPDIGDPACEFVGQEFDGFVFGVWRSEGGLAPAEGVPLAFDRIFDETLPDASDEFGASEPTVYAISDDGDEAAAVVTTIITRPADFAGEGPLRVALSTSWVRDDGEWKMRQLVSAYVLAEDFLRPSPEVESYYPNWERFQE